MTGLVLHLPKFMVYYRFSPGFIFLVISVLAKRLAEKSISDMTYIMSSEMLNLNSINQSNLILHTNTNYKVTYIIYQNTIIFNDGGPTVPSKHTPNEKLQITAI